MEAITALLGLGLSVSGMVGGMGASHDYNEAQKRQVQGEQLVEAQRQQAATLMHERNQMQILRNNQRARSMGLEAATTQGAQQGSGLAGAYGQIRGQSGVDLLGENQNFEIGQNVFGLNAQISQQKIAQANAQQSMQFFQGLGSFGSSITGSARNIGNLTSGFGSTTNAAPRPSFNPFG